MIGDWIRTERTERFDTFGEYYAECVRQGLRVSPSTLLNWEKGQKVPAYAAPYICDALSGELDDMLRGDEWRQFSIPGTGAVQRESLSIGSTP